jgi:outer membrane lipoprotein-sorting protein
LILSPAILRLSILLFFSPAAYAQSLTAVEVFHKMMNAMKQVKTASFVLDINERIKGEMRHDQFIVKLNTRPYKAYVYSVTPNPGAEALYIEGENAGKAIINPNMRLIPTLHLSPYHPILRRNHQFTLLHFGFEYVYDVCSGYVQKFGNRFYDYLRLDKEITFNNQTYLQLILQTNEFKWVPYTVQKGENLVSISKKLLVNDYMILENNPKLKNYDDVKEGQIIKVPTVFGKKIIFYVDKLSFLPMVQIVYDDKGLYSRIEYSSFVMNPAFTEEDFSKKNKKYGF